MHIPDLIHPHYLLPEPHLDPLDSTDEREKDTNSSSYPSYVGSDPPGSVFIGIEEAICVEALSSGGDIGDTKIASEEDDEEGDVDPGHRPDSGEDDLEEGKESVQGMDGDLLEDRALAMLR